MAGNSDAANPAGSGPKTVVGEMVTNVGDLFNQESRNPVAIWPFGFRTRLAMSLLQRTA